MCNEIEIPDILKPLVGQDWIELDAALKRCGGIDSYLPVLEIFYEVLDSNADSIDEYYQDEDWEDYALKVHSLKSTARLVGAVPLGAEAEQLEYASKNKDLDYINANHKAFIDNYRSCKAPLEEIFDKD